MIDRERLLAECEDFLVDDRDGSKLGVVEGVERSAPDGAVSALIVSAGWFGRRRLRVDAHAIEEILPEEQRVIVDGSRLHPISGES